MKKIIYFALGLALMAGFTTSCSDDDDDNAVVSATPSADIAGTYSGTWTMTQSGKDAVEAEGTLDLTATDTYVAGITVPANTAINLKEAMTSVANVTAAQGSGNVFYRLMNEKSYAKFTTASGTTYSAVYGISGKVIDGVLTLDFTISVRSGRNNVETAYKFVGSK